MPPSDRNIMKFLWFENNDLSVALVEYRLTVNVFRATSSPSCANFALCHTVLSEDFDDNETLKQIVLHSFYVNDLMVSE